METPSFYMCSVIKQVIARNNIQDISHTYLTKVNKDGANTLRLKIVFADITVFICFP